MTTSPKGNEIGSMFTAWRHASPRRALAIAVASLAAVTCVGPVVEAGALGPYTVWFNQRMKARAEHAGLVGRPDSVVEKVLGRADNIVTHRAPRRLSPDGGGWLGEGGRTFEYYPYPFLPFSKVQVHCPAGVVTGIELFDD